MHILFLTDNFPPETNAPASRTYEHARVWVEKGHQVTVITGAPNFPSGKVFDGYRNRWLGHEIIDGINVIRVKTYITANTGFLRRSLDFLSFMVSGSIAGIFVKRPDIVVATSPQFFTAVAGWFVALVRRRPFVFELRDIWPASLTAVGMEPKKLVIGLLEEVELFLYRRATMIVSVTHSFKEDLIRRGIDGDKVQIVLNGVDRNQYSPHLRNGNPFRRLFQIENKFVVGYVGTHGMAHGLLHILDSAERLEPLNDIAFVFIGDGAEKKMLEDEIVARGLKNVFSFPGYPKNDMPRLWCSLDVSLISLRDTELFKKVIPSKIFESMGSGLPMIVVAPDGEATRLVSEVGAGLTCQPANAEALTDAILRLYNDLDLRETMQKNSLQASGNYDRDYLAKKLLSLFEEILS